MLKAQVKTKPTIKDLLLIGITPVFTVKYNRTWEEWIVHHPTNKAANYHTNDKDDAVATAHAMAKHEGLSLDEYTVRIK